MERDGGHRVIEGGDIEGAAGNGDIPGVRKRIGNSKSDGAGADRGAAGVGVVSA